MRVPECVSMLLFLLWAVMGLEVEGVARATPAALTEPSALLLEPWVAGEPSGFGLGALSPARDSLAAAVSTRGAGHASPRGDWGGCLSIGAGVSVGLVWLSALADEGAVLSASVVVEVERVLDEEARAGAEKVLDWAEWSVSCEAGMSDWCGLAIDGVGAESGASSGAMDM